MSNLQGESGSIIARRPWRGLEHTHADYHDNRVSRGHSAYRRGSRARADEGKPDKGGVDGGRGGRFIWQYLDLDDANHAVGVAFRRVFPGLIRQVV